MTSFWNKQLAPVKGGDIINMFKYSRDDNATPGLCCVTRRLHFTMERQRLIMNCVSPCSQSAAPWFPGWSAGLWSQLGPQWRIRAQRNTKVDIPYSAIYWWGKILTDWLYLDI